MKRILAVVAAIALPVCFGQAARADAFDWGRPYVGVNVGVAVSESSETTNVAYSPIGYFATSSPGAIDTAGNQSSGTTGFTGGAQLGFNHMLDSNWLVGAEVDFGADDNSSSASSTGTYPCCSPDTFTVTSKVHTNWLLTVRPKIGYAWDRWMAYITGGVALTDELTKFSFVDDFGATESARQSRIRSAAALGLGLEHALTDNWTCRLEYLYTDFGAVHLSSTNLTYLATTYPQNPFTHQATLSENLVRIAFNHSF